MPLVVIGLVIAVAGHGEPVVFFERLLQIHMGLKKDHGFLVLGLGCGKVAIVKVAEGLECSYGGISALLQRGKHVRDVLLLYAGIGGNGVGERVIVGALEQVRARHPPFRIGLALKCCVHGVPAGVPTVVGTRLSSPVGRAFRGKLTLFKLCLLSGGIHSFGVEGLVHEVVRRRSVRKQVVLVVALGNLVGIYDEWISEQVMSLMNRLNLESDLRRLNSLT